MRDVNCGFNVQTMNKKSLFIPDAPNGHFCVIIMLISNFKMEQNGYITEYAGRARTSAGIRRKENRYSEGRGRIEKEAVMKNERKSGLWKRTFAVMFAAMLIVGTLQGVSLVDAMAEGVAGPEADVSGNTAEIPGNAAQIELTAESVLAEEGSARMILYLVIDGYEGNDTQILGSIVLKNTETGDALTPQIELQSSADGKKMIRCAVEGLDMGKTYQWFLGGKEICDPKTIEMATSSISAQRIFCTVDFKDGANIYETKYVYSGFAEEPYFSRKVTAPDVAPAKDGYTFAGWVTTEGGSDLFDFNQPITGVTTIYASWTENPEPPVVRTQPNEAYYVTSGRQVELKVEASGENLTYQWQVKENGGDGFADIDGAVSDVLQVTNPTDSQDGNLYRCVITNAAGSVISKETELVVEDFRIEKAEREIQKALDGITATNASDEESILSVVETALKDAGITRVNLTIRNFEKTEASGETDGTIKGRINFKCSSGSTSYSPTGSIGFDKIIARLVHGGSDSGNNKDDNNNSDDNGNNVNSNDNGSNSDSGNNGGNNNHADQNSAPDKNGKKPGSAKDNEPATGEAVPLEFYAILAMIAGSGYLCLCHGQSGQTCGKGMT